MLWPRDCPLHLQDLFLSPNSNGGGGGVLLLARRVPTCPTSLPARFPLVTNPPGFLAVGEALPNPHPCLHGIAQPQKKCMRAGTAAQAGEQEGHGRWAWTVCAASKNCRWGPGPFQGESTDGQGAGQEHRGQSSDRKWGCSQGHSMATRNFSQECLQAGHRGKSRLLQAPQQ